MWTRFNVRWEFQTNLCASVPADPQMIKRWLESRKPATRPPDTKSIDEVAAEVAETVLVPEDQPPSLLVFQRVDGKLVTRAMTGRSHIKDCAQILSSLYVGKIEREKSFAVKVKQAIYWAPENYWIPIVRRDGAPVTEADGQIERPIHAFTPQGVISALKVFEYVTDAVMEFPLLVLTTPKGTPVVSESDLKTIFMYGGMHGYAGERSLDGGRYVFSIAEAQG